MYESEANGTVESGEQIPLAVINAFSELQGRIVSRTVLPWSEHCTECMWPTCYTTCDLYSAREDGRCRRFVDGMVRAECPTAVNQYLLKIRFKRWAKLWTPGNLQLRTSQQASNVESWDHRLGTTLYKLPLPEQLRSFAIRKRYGWKKRRAWGAPHGGGSPTSLVVECFNPTNHVVDLSLTIRSKRKQEQLIPYQRMFRLEPGFQRLQCSFAEIAAIVDLSFPFDIELVPNGSEEETSLYFGLMDFIQEALPAAENKGKIKCVIWDLDHTMWNGVLVEDGAEKLTLKPEVKRVIETLDQRGILQSIVSKNNHDEAMAVLAQFGLMEYFLSPQISWQSKGEGVKAIAQRLNIGIDSILFIDDQQFERMEVESSCPGVRTMDATRYLTLPQLKECQASVTTESRNRRKMYQENEERREIQESFKEDYKAFLKHCEIRLKVSELTEENLERVHELTQRTNQMNFSGNRYDREVLREMLGSPHLDTYVLACEDKFGSYGIVGFGVVDKQEPRLTDLMFSCRIQSKRVEHAFLRTIIHRYRSETKQAFHANYRKTQRNMPSGKVFEDLGLIETGIQNGTTLLVLPHDNILPDDGIILVEMPASHLTGISQ